MGDKRKRRNGRVTCIRHLWKRKRFSNTDLDIIPSRRLMVLVSHYIKSESCALESLEIGSMLAMQSEARVPNGSFMGIEKFHEDFIEHAGEMKMSLWVVYWWQVSKT